MNYAHGKDTGYSLETAAIFIVDSLLVEGTSVRIADLGESEPGKTVD